MEINRNTQAFLQIQKIAGKAANFKAIAERLALGLWQDADWETARVMVELTNRQEYGWLDTNSCKNFPREDLQIIDNLWTEYSGHRFGFSVQKKIWIDCGGTSGVFDQDVYIKFCHQTGWKRGERWLAYSDLTFNINAPLGHLPGKTGGVVWDEGNLLFRAVLLFALL